MAMQAESPAATPPAQIVGNAFVEQYYHILHQSPELVYRFYQDSSVLSRPDASGAITSATTMQGINEKILSLNYKDFVAEIKTADAQQSLGDGVVVLVTGYLTERENVRKKFAQTFFLAPQEKGYYVLNDVFRYIEDEHTPEPVSAPASVNRELAQPAVQVPEPEQPRHVADLSEHVQEPLNEEELELANEPEICDPSDIEDGSVAEEEVIDPPPTHLDQSENNVTVTSVPPVSQEDEPKRSYASILKAMKTNPSPVPAREPVKVKRPVSDKETTGAPKLPAVLEALAPNYEAGTEKTDALEEENFSIYVRNLPQSASAAQVEEAFAKFGPIKQGGVQVRSNKQGFCFGFVEFESLSSMKSAIEASPVLIGNRKATVESKRTTARVPGPANPNNGRGGRYPASRGGFRSESFRGRGNFGGGRGYGRNEFRGQGEFSGRPRGGATGRGSGSEGYPRVEQNGSGNAARQTGQK